MATTAEIDAGILELRTARHKLAQKAEERARAVLVRDKAATDLQRVTTEALAARDAVTAAKTALQALLTAPEV